METIFKIWWSLFRSKAAKRAIIEFWETLKNEEEEKKEEDSKDKNMDKNMNLNMDMNMDKNNYNKSEHWNAHHRFPMKLGLLMLQDKEILKT